MFAKHFYSFARNQFVMVPTRQSAWIYLIRFCQAPCEKKLTFDLSVAKLAFIVVADDPGVLAMATIVHAGRLFDAVG